ncbi:MAG: 16S rRNA (cytosine(967)-C(5))-methyltransferase RsmB [Clostridiaceae bacterium]|nr:16S rRNA (cytosine(967)-C(5))-methyltransferase RsmB [Clostridiaceae bacterium]
MRSIERENSLEALSDWHKTGSWPDLYLKSKLEPLTRAQASLVTMITYGVIQNQSLIDYYIGLYSSLKLNKVSPYVLEAMRIAVYQILFLDKVPDSAAVNESINLINKTGNRRAAGFANGVLRKIVREKNNLPEIKGRSREETLAIKYSNPLWLTKKFIKIFGFEETEELLAANNESVVPSIRVNTIKTDSEAFIREASVIMGQEPVKSELVNDGFYVSELATLLKSPLFENGHFYVQDIASQLAVNILAPKPYEKVLDLCAAPGGKSLLAAQLMENHGLIVSNDIYPHKTALIIKNAARYGCDIIQESCKDASLYITEYSEQFDSIICDVPCSGLGIIRKKPDIRFKDESSLSELPRLQRAILENAASYLKPGGNLIYTTCTILPEENEDIINDFLISHNNFSLTPFTIGQKLYPGIVTLLPHRDNTDGFFISRIERRP